MVLQKTSQLDRVERLHPKNIIHSVVRLFDLRLVAGVEVAKGNVPIATTDAWAGHGSSFMHPNSSSSVCASSEWVPGHCHMQHPNGISS